MELKGSKTEQNLMTAFAGESQARNKYTYFASKAKKEGYGVAAPNVFNRETIEACFLAAKKLRAPIILDVAAVHGIYECADIARYYEKQYPEVPFALNLDHGGAYEDIVKAIQTFENRKENQEDK